jgi:hypothetical protein
MGICDDGPYILVAQKLATTGHIIYNGWVSPMLVWQAYLGAAFIKLFGFSLTTVRSSALLVAMALAFVLQRTLVRANISERNATIGTLALVLSPLYLMLSVSFMSDIFGLFAIVLCLYGCLRALQSSNDRSAIAWLSFAVLTNALFGTSRQIAWLGVLVMVPSTLWLLRSRRRVLLAGAAANLAGALFVLACMRWFAHQPYTMPEHLIPSAFPLFHTLSELMHAFLNLPFLLLPIVALFLLPGIRASRPRVIAITSALFLGYLFWAVHPPHLHRISLLEPAMGDWVNEYGILSESGLQGVRPLFLHTGVRMLLTIASLGGLLGLVALLLRSRRTFPAVDSSPSVSWKKLGVLLAPFTLTYALLLIPRAATAGLSDRYLLGLLVVALLCLVRYYQERIQPQLPLASVLLIAVMAIYGITVTHNTFALYRARVAVAAELRADGIPDTSVDNGWEYNFDVELQHADHINDSTIVVPANAYTRTPPPPAGPCQMFYYDETPHIHPLSGVSFDPNACYGPAPFAPVHYSRWLAASPGTLYAVRYTPASQH